ncbi:hypothetical protein WNZ14_20485 [Hoeflea sp. AS60]|uniref:hypothetical protein n=1 Tax=Hoeflea sp. AS60 TaxID=3135780 RepID=UPI003173FA46
MICKAILGRQIFAIILFATSAGASEASDVSTTPSGASQPSWIRLPELRAYAENPPYEEVATTLFSVLAYIPGATVGEQETVANVGYKLGNDIYVIPLNDRVSETDRRTIRASGCRTADRAITDHIQSVLYLSVGDGSERACIAVKTSLLGTSQLLELLRDVDRNGCLADFRFSKSVFMKLSRDANSLNGGPTDTVQQIIRDSFHRECGVAHD